MQAEILTVGDEILIGQIINTNAAWLGEQLSLLGISVERVVSVGDNVDQIAREMRRATEEVDLLVVTGGLGPTHDDVTKTALARFCNVDFYLDEKVLDSIVERFRKRGIKMAESNRSQALIPEGCVPLANPAGTAPGLWCVHEYAGRERIIVLMPGVPHEMKVISEVEVLPRLRRHSGREVILYKTLLTAGIGESNMAELLGDMSAWLRDGLTLAYLPRPGGVRLRVTGRAKDESVVRERLEEFERFLRDKLGELVYGEGGDELEAVVGRLLKDLGLTIAIAESCTGGYVLDVMTNVPGSSAYLQGGIVAYSNRAKISELGVDPDILAREGAVSKEVARQMAAGVREKWNTSIGLSTTGVAGPSGGTPEKPIGTVWIGYADETKNFAFKLQLVSDRRLNKELTCTALLNLLRRELLNTQYRNLQRISDSAETENL